MAKQLQLRGGTTAQHSTFTGAVREVTVDTDKDVVVVHDGATVGGFPMAKKTDVDSAIGTAVLLTGNQTIDGTKTFSSTISGSITGNAGSATTATTATTAGSCTGNSATATSATSATTATNLANGSAGTIPYQSASGTTAQLASGTSGYYLKSNGAAAPSWAEVSASVTWSQVNSKPTRADWATIGSISNVVGQLAWKNYGNTHTIFDASNGTSPDGGAVSSTNAQVAWSASYPTLMGWNGVQTYGVRVDSARVADTAGNGTVASSLAANGYQRFGNGFIIQWATQTQTASSNHITWTYPIAFPSACVLAYCMKRSTGDGSGLNAIYAQEISTTSVNFYEYNSVNAGQTRVCYAIGY